MALAPDCKEYLDNEEFRLSLEQWTELVVELLVDGLDCDVAAVGGVDVPVAAVRQDYEDNHVAG